ncbi:MAG: HD domain-containing protein [Acetatifactor sp.]|nr:HD domain-containing protein [Acetatifactor sp.]
MRDIILLADAGEFNRILLKNVFKDEFKVMESGLGADTIAIVDAHNESIAAVLLDLSMPDMTGEEILLDFSNKGYLSQFPVVVIATDQTMDRIEQCYELGISTYIKRPFKPNIVKQSVKRMCEIYYQKNDYFDKLGKSAVTLKNQMALLQTQAEEIKKNNDKILEAIGTIAEYRNMESSSHIQNVKVYTGILATTIMEKYPEYELTPEKVRIIVSASALHDVGKIVVPDSVLLKPGKLTKEEYELMCSHTLRGYDIIDRINGAWDETYGTYCKEIARSHHERYDGKGYPEGLVGDETPISAQIVAIADCFDALLSDRVYKAACEFGEAFSMIIRGECGVFSPKLTECFRESRPKLREYYNKIHGIEGAEDTEDDPDMDDD